MIEVYGYSIATIPVVVTIVYGCIELLKKYIFANVTNFGKYIPLLAACIGGVVALLAYFISPTIVPVSTWYSAIIVGCASGLSSVGINQIKKQMTKQGGENSGS